jgi:hypothetical protein
MSALISTFSNGFAGIHFNLWLKNFIFELSSNSHQSFNLISDDYFSQFDNILIPFCSPSLKAEWPEHFARYLIENGNACLGTIDSSLDKETRDFVFKKFDHDIGIISGECKNYSTPLGSSKIFDIIKKLHTYQAPINIACNQISDLTLKKNLIKYLDGIEKTEIDCKFCVYELKTENQDYKLDCLYKTTTAQSKPFLIIDVSSL